MIRGFLNLSQVQELCTYRIRLNSEAEWEMLTDWFNHQKETRVMAACQLNKEVLNTYKNHGSISDHDMVQLLKGAGLAEQQAQFWVQAHGTAAVWRSLNVAPLAPFTSRKVPLLVKQIRTALEGQQSMNIDPTALSLPAMALNNEEVANDLSLHSVAGQVKQAIMRGKSCNVPALLDGSINNGEIAETTPGAASSHKQEEKDDSKTKAELDALRAIVESQKDAIGQLKEELKSKADNDDLYESLKESFKASKGSVTAGETSTTTSKSHLPNLEEQQKEIVKAIDATAKKQSQPKVATPKAPTPPAKAATSTPKPATQVGPNKEIINVEGSDEMPLSGDAGNVLLSQMDPYDPMMDQDSQVLPEIPPPISLSGSPPPLPSPAADSQCKRNKIVD